MFLIFFFKQKTAYEMRISDWSADVCSSDLDGLDHRVVLGKDADLAGRVLQVKQHRFLGNREDLAHFPCGLAACRPQQAVALTIREAHADAPGRVLAQGEEGLVCVNRHPDEIRSEEHTSELQSLMRNSYAVFCLK